MRQRFYIFVECHVGHAVQVARAVKAFDLPFFAEVAITSGDWDILIRAEPDSNAEIARVLVEPLQHLQHVIRTRTEVAYPIYDPDDIYFSLDGDV